MTWLGFLCRDHTGECGFLCHLGRRILKSTAPLIEFFTGMFCSFRGIDYLRQRR